MSEDLTKGVVPPPDESLEALLEFAAEKDLNSDPLHRSMISEIYDQVVGDEKKEFYLGAAAVCSFILHTLNDPKRVNIVENPKNFKMFMRALYLVIAERALTSNTVRNEVAIRIRMAVNLFTQLKVEEGLKALEKLIEAE